LRDFCIGFFVLDPDEMSEYCKDKNVEFNDELMENEELKKEVYKSLL